MKSLKHPFVYRIGNWGNDTYTQPKDPIKNPGDNGHNPPIPPKKENRFEFEINEALVHAASICFAWLQLFWMRPNYCTGYAWGHAGSADLDDLF